MHVPVLSIVSVFCSAEQRKRLWTSALADWVCGASGLTDLLQLKASSALKTTVLRRVLLGACSSECAANCEQPWAMRAGRVMLQLAAGLECAMVEARQLKDYFCSLVCFDVSLDACSSWELLRVVTGRECAARAAATWAVAVAGRTCILMHYNLSLWVCDVASCC